MLNEPDCVACAVGLSAITVGHQASLTALYVQLVRMVLFLVELPAHFLCLVSI